MSLENSDFVFIGSLYHAQTCALLSTLQKLFGPAQAIILSEYATEFKKILARGGAEYSRILDNLETLKNSLEAKGLVKDLRIDYLDKNRVKLSVEKCFMSQIVHPTLNLADSRNFLCPIATMAIVALANERGFKEGGNIFDYIKFEDNLSLLTKEGSETNLVIA